MLRAVLLFFLFASLASAMAADEAALGRAAKEAGRYTDALTHYAAALAATAPGSDAEYRLLEEAAPLFPKGRPMPPLPEEAERRFVRGQAVVKMAKDREAFLRAADEFRAAARAAPWLADAYFNLGIMLDKAERYADAIKALKLYVLAAPSSKDAKDAQRLIYEIEVKEEDVQRARAKESVDSAARAEAQRQEQHRRAALVQRLSGEWLMDVGNWYRYRFTVTGNEFDAVMIAADYRNGRGWQPVHYRSAMHGIVDGLMVTGNWEEETTHDGTVSGRGTGKFRRGILTGTIRSDGEFMEMKGADGYLRPFKRY